MMNIRDYFSINKTKTTNKIKILDLLGFEPDIEIDSSQYQVDIVMVSIKNEDRFKEIKDYKRCYGTPNKKLFII